MDQLARRIQTLPHQSEKIKSHNDFEKFSVNLRKQKRIEKTMKARKERESYDKIDIPQEFLNNFPYLKDESNFSIILQHLLKISVYEIEEFSLIGIDLFIQYIKLRQSQSKDLKITREITDGLISNLKTSSKVLKEKTLYLIAIIFSFSSNPMQINDFFDLLIEILNIIRTSPIFVNRSLNIIYDSTSVINKNSQILEKVLISINHVLETSVLATNDNKMMIAKIYRSINYKGLSNTLKEKVDQNLKSLIQSDYLKVKILALKTISHFHQYYYLKLDNWMLIIPELLFILSSGVPEEIITALSFMQLVTSNDDYFSQMLVNCGALNKLIDLFLNYKTDKPSTRADISIHLIIAGIILNLLAGSTYIIMNILSYPKNIIDEILIYTKRPLYFEALMCIHNVVLHKKTETTKKIIELDVVPRMFFFMNLVNISSDPRCINLIYKILRSLNKQLDCEEWFKLVNDINDSVVDENVVQIYNWVKDPKNLKILEKIFHIFEGDYCRAPRLEHVSQFNF